jgi:transposase
MKKQDQEPIQMSDDQQILRRLILSEILAPPLALRHFQQRKIKIMSKNQKNNYPLEFKVSSAQLAIDSEQPVAQTARDLGINHNTLHGWIDKYSDSNQINQKNMSNNKAACFEENKRLKKELALVKQERDLLKKAAAYFAKESR